MKKILFSIIFALSISTASANEEIKTGKLLGYPKAIARLVEFQTENRSLDGGRLVMAFLEDQAETMDVTATDLVGACKLLVEADES